MSGLVDPARKVIHDYDETAEDPEQNLQCSKESRNVAYQVSWILYSAAAVQPTKFRHKHM